MGRVLYGKRSSLRTVPRNNIKSSRQQETIPCDDESVQDITDLKRELSDNENKIHLYLANLMVDAHNIPRLDLLEGDRVSFKATNAGDIRGLDCPAPEISYFKPGAPVMILYNINEIRKLHSKSCDYLYTRC